jgi:hypothetical protein
MKSLTRCDKATIRHIAEAEAQGATLNGAALKDYGRATSHYRNYTLKCGHPHDVRTGCMRKGEFMCKKCFKEKLEAEAKAQGATLNGAALKGDANYRNYTLKCGDNQDVAKARMKDGVFKCQACLFRKHQEEANSQGAVLIGAALSGKTRYGNYALECSHQQEIRYNNMARGKFTCKICLTHKLEAEARAQGAILNGAALNDKSSRRNYTLKCGHKQVVETGNMRIGEFMCKKCFKEKLEAEAKAQGAILIGAALKDYGRTSSHYRNYTLECGHNQDVQFEKMAIGRFKCQTCLINKHTAEAKAQGATLNGAALVGDYKSRNYTLKCGHNQDVNACNMKTGGFNCQTCEESWATKPSGIYLNLMTNGDKLFLKLGVAKSVEARASTYNNKGILDFECVYSFPTLTGLDAKAIEGAIHKKYKGYTPKQAKALGMKSGFTECYPIELQAALLRKLKQAGQDYNRQAKAS